MPDQAHKDRRQLKRSVQRISARVECDGHVGDGYIKNLTKQGLFVRTELPLQPGATVHVSFEPEGSPKIDLTGTVRWTTAQLPNAAEVPPGFGLKLDSVPVSYSDFFEQSVMK